MRLTSSPIGASMVLSKALLVAIALLECQPVTAMVATTAAGFRRDISASSPIIPRANERSTFDPAASAGSKTECKMTNPSWECLKPEVRFPTVECLKKDMRTCGIVGDKTIFYYFGARAAEVAPFRDQKNGVMFRDVMDDDWWKRLQANPAFRLEDQARQRLFIARFYEAMADESHGEVYLTVPRDIIRAGGAYVLPKNRPDNLWHDLWFPRLQQNPHVTKVTLVDITTTEGNRQTFPEHQGWLPLDDKYPELPYNNELADKLLEQNDDKPSPDKLRHSYGAGRLGPPKMGVIPEHIRKIIENPFWQIEALDKESSLWEKRWLEGLV